MKIRIYPDEGGKLYGVSIVEDADGVTEEQVSKAMGGVRFPALVGPNVDEKGVVVEAAEQRAVQMKDRIRAVYTKLTTGKGKMFDAVTGLEV